MSDSEELKRLRADLEVLERYNGCGYNIFINDAVKETKEKIAEAEADPWNKGKKFAETYRNSPSDRGDAAHYIDHLDAENARLTARVAELEKEPEFTPAVLKRADEVATGDIVLAGGTIRAVTMIDADHSNHPNKRIIKCDGWMAWLDNHDLIAVLHKPLVEAKPIADMPPPFEDPIVGFDPVLEPNRVLATAVEILKMIRDKAPSLHPVEGLLQRAIFAVEQYSRYGRHEYPMHYKLKGPAK